MDPELLDLLRKAAEARRRGLPADKINERIAAATDSTYTDFRSLAVAARDAGVTREELGRGPGADPSGEGKGLFAGVDRVGRLAGEVLSFGLLDEGAAGLRGAVEAAGAILPGGRSPGQAFREGRDAELAASRERLRRAEEEAGTGTKVLGFGLGLLGPGAAAGKIVTRGAGTAARAGRGAAVGAGEGGLFGFGTAEGSVGERLPQAGTGAVAGGLLGAAIPAGVDGARVVGKGAKAAAGAAKKAGGKLRRGARALDDLDEIEELERTIGPRLGERMRRGADIEGQPSKVRAEVREARRGIYGPLDEIDEIADEPLQQALRLDDVKPYVPEEVAAGARPPSFPEAQGALRQVRKAKGAAMRSGDAASVRRLAEAEREIGTRLSDAVEGLDEANQAYATHMARARALESGSKVASKSADEVQEAFDALGSDVERQAFREGLGHWWLKRLEGITAIPTTLKKIQNSPEAQANLRILFQDEDAYNAFLDAARQAERVRDRAKSGRLIERELLRQLGRALPWLGGIGAGGVGASMLN